MLTVHWKIKEFITIDFLEKAASVNCRFVRQNSPYLLNESCTYKLEEISKYGLTNTKKKVG